MRELVNILSHLMAANTYGKSVYCTLIGECVVNNVKITPEETVVMLQQVKGDMDRVFCCDEFGRPCGSPDAECCVFPSKVNRDWSTFDATPRYDISQLKPFDKVLARYESYGGEEPTPWKPAFFVRHIPEADQFELLPGYSKHCVPYNDETKHLLGTMDEAPEYYKTWKSDKNEQQ